MNLLIRIVALLSALNLIKGDIFRLSRHIKPTFYGIALDVSVKHGKFIGDVYIDIKIDPFSVNSIKLHMSSNLKIHEIFLDQELAQYKLKPSDELLEVSYNNSAEISPGFHRIRVKYNGSLVDKTNGFFKAKYTDLDGRVLSELAVTDFEPTYARTAFPCFDEPAFKAKYTVAIIVRDDNYTALSNMKQMMPEIQIPHGFLYKFHTSCPMSSYLVAFAIIPYNSTKTTVKIGCRTIPIKIWSHHLTNETLQARALDYASYSLKFYAEYLDYADPMPKIDFVEYDRGSSQATENWGLITVSKGYLKKLGGNNNNSNRATKRSSYEIAIMLMHEVAHFWFGNLVTNDWWDDLWLQESFAEYLSMKAVEKLIHIKNQETIQELYEKEIESDLNPVVTKIRQYSDITNLFNEVVYYKGAVILQMLELATGHKIFQEILRQYVARFKFKSVSTHDFLDVVERNSVHLKADLRGFLESYLYQNRYPIISVEEDLERYVYVLKQQSCNNTKPRGLDYDYIWTIPVSYFTNLNPKYSIAWFGKDVELLIIPKSNESWIKFNYRNLGFYRVNYSESLWQRIFDFGDTLNEKEHSNLLYEAIELFKFGFISCKIPVKYFDALVKMGFRSSIEGPLSAFNATLKSRNIPQEIIRKFTDYLMINGEVMPEVTRTKRSNSTSLYMNGTRISENINADCVKSIDDLVSK